ncbi:hypothetical protein N9P66_03205 [Salibacteraceae bacterium]|nr:hypothetical protein [Salibacteraceae bacterium]
MINPITTIPVDHFFRGAFSIDMVLITFIDDELKVLLQEKNEPPHEGELGLPGKLILPIEDTDQAMNNFMTDLIGTNEFYKKQLKAFSDVNRHPMGRVISFAYYGLIHFEKFNEPLAEGLSWRNAYEVSGLCFDHDRILKSVLKRFRKGLLRHPTVFEILPKKFILSDVKRIYDLVFDTELDSPNFRKMIRKSDLIYPTGEIKHEKDFIGRPPKFYSFNRERYLGEFKERIHFYF